MRSALAGWLDQIEQAIEREGDVDKVPLDLHGTEFQLRVWQALREIPRGQTLTYGQLSRRLGLPVGAARAVGTACGANPVSYLVPCHRVIPAGGGLGGYRWGLERKKRLLERERGNGSHAQSLLAFAES